MSVQSLINNEDFNGLSKYFSDFVEVNDFEEKITNRGKGNSSVCATCGCKELMEDYTQGIVVCTNNKCGEVQQRSMYDQNPEWKQYDDDDKAGARCSQAVNVLLPQSSLGTSVGGYANSRTKRLAGWVHMPYSERSLNNEFKKIHEVCQKAEIFKCVEDDTKIMYKMASECRYQTGKNKGRIVITRGVNRRSIIAACLFFACVRKGVTRTSKEIAQLWDIGESEMNRGRRNLQKLFKLKDQAKKLMLTKDTSKPEHFIRRYCTALKLKNQYIEDALKIAINVDKLNLASGHTPCSSAAACILLMAELNNLEHITKKRLSNECDVSDSTIFKTYKEMEPYKHVLMNTDSTNEIVNQINKDMVTQEVPPEILERMKKFGISTTSSSSSLSSNVVNQSTKSIQLNKSLQSLPKVNSNSSFIKVVNDNSSQMLNDDDEIELELDENYDESKDFEYFDDNYYGDQENREYEENIGMNISDSDDFFTEKPETIKKIKKVSSHDQIREQIESNENLAISLKEKFALVSKLIKNKSLKDMKKELEVLQSSHDLIKSIKNDLNQYAIDNLL